ncbi:hypothetical protein COCOBI_18-3150 [Coccomyxa sp. Obi]|nr:hypothetical protein COCOBI_18-3150 [Coccomyxa sp. Obi]
MPSTRGSETRVSTMKKSGVLSQARSSAKKQAKAPHRPALAKRGVESDAHTPTTGKLVELLYAQHLVDDILAYQKQKPPKAKPSVKCYSGPLEDFIDTVDMDTAVMLITRAMNKYLAGTTDDRLHHIDQLVETFTITNPNHPAKRHHDKCHRWLGLRQVERGLRAKQDLKGLALLGEYCGVVKTSDAHERDTAAACPEDPTLGYIIRDKTEAINDDLDLPNGHWAKDTQLIVDASKAGNCLSLINDARGFRPGKQPNVTFIQTHDRATSELHIFLVTQRPIKKGHEILLDYGESFWQEMSAKLVWAEKMAAKEQALQSAKAELQSIKKEVAMLEVNYKGALKLSKSMDERYLEAADRLSEREKQIRRLQEEKKAAITAREGELKRVRADHSAAIAHAASLQEQLGKSQAQVIKMSIGKQVLQERLTSLRASYERQSFEVHQLERAQAVGLQAAHAAAQRMHQDILAAEAELRAKEREHAALVAACQDHQRREDDMARQVALTRARLAAAESVEEAAESARDALARNLRVREAELAAREADLNRERARRETAAIAKRAPRESPATGAAEDVPMETTKDIMARLERLGACLSAKPPVGCNAGASGPKLLTGLERGVQLALPQAERDLPTFADLAEAYNIRHGLASPGPQTAAAIAIDPLSPAEQRLPGIAQEPLSTAVLPYTAAAVAPDTPTKQEQKTTAPPPKKEPTHEAPANFEAEAATGGDLCEMLVADTIVEEEGELAVSEQDSCGYKSGPTARVPRGGQLSASSARRPRTCPRTRARRDRGRSRTRGRPGTNRMNLTASSGGSFSPERSRPGDHGKQHMKLTGSFSPERSRRGGQGRGRSRSRKRARSDRSPGFCHSPNRSGPCTWHMNLTSSFSRECGHCGGRGRGRKRARSSRSAGSRRSRSRCGVSERGRRIYAPHERPWRNDRSRRRSRSPVRRSCNASRSCSAKFGAQVPLGADPPSSPSNASASSHAVNPSEPISSPKGGCIAAGNAVNPVETSKWGAQGGNAAIDSRFAPPGAAWNASAVVCASNQVPMPRALPATSLHGNVLWLRFPATDRPFPAKRFHNGNIKHCE